MIKKMYTALLIACLFSACKEPQPPVLGAYEEGVFTVNEGVFGQTSGTITHFNRTTKTTQTKIFKQVNQRDLGDVVQSMCFYEDKAYIVVNNSNKIEVVDANTFEEKAQIMGLKLPRYFLPISSTKAYVSEWGADGLTGTVGVLDLTTNTLSNQIVVGKGPERMLLKDGKVFLTHVGGYGSNNIVTVLNTATDQVEATINVLDKPSACVEDGDGNLWVACAGQVAYLTYPTIDTINSTASGLVQIDPNTHAVLATHSFGKGKPVGNLIINSNLNNELYYTRSNKVWKYTTTTGVEEELFEGSFYGLGFDPNTNYIYAATSSGVNLATAKRYQTDGTLVDNYSVGVFANSFVTK
ncbi:DUF5074 domain-containing protein [Aureispira anguillae]|uniref:40-residue YVTN family beta-propeller repeat-containing protein n=1 Tax=Aureispira anguillae TaxID=2864201 RepID=A0A915VKL5_9BACT|nr:DUF5074 domain-containing protein [Aureispira anguillae]BDS09680.1 hypothetical protein AsAng_0003840 [Aureispira anguillae]